MQVLDSKHATTGASPQAEVPRPMNDAWIAHKFGGTSLADASCLRQVASILRARPERHQAIVVSAMRGVTDALLALALSASRAESGWSEALAGLRTRHLDAARELLGDDAPATEQWLDRQFAELGNLLHALSVLGAPGREALERIQGLGELYSAQLLSTYMQSLGEPTACMDAREVLVVRNGELGVAVDWAQSAFLLASCAKASAAARRDHRLHRPRRGRPRDDPRAQRQRFFRRDIRGAVRRQRTAYLDRRRRRSLGRSAPGPGSGAAGVAVAITRRSNWPTSAPRSSIRRR